LPSLRSRLNTPDDHLAGAAGEYLEGAAGAARTGIDHERTGKAGVKFGQLANQRALERPALDGIEVGDITLVNIELGVERPQQGRGIADSVGYQLRLERRVAGALSRLRVNGHAAREIQYRNDSHDAS
jgi:hypothetical protein